jgi:hypothetical protein
MGLKKAITVRLDAAEYDQLVAEAKRRNVSPGVLAGNIVRTSLVGRVDTSVQRGKDEAGFDVLSGLAALRERSAKNGPVDVVTLIQKAVTFLTSGRRFR